MTADPNKYLLRVLPNPTPGKRQGKQNKQPRAASYPLTRQRDSFQPKFQRLADVLARDVAGLELRADPSAIAPERLLVFEIKGEVSRFAEAVRNVPGLEWIEEEALENMADGAAIAYMMLPDARALLELGRLWHTWMETGRLPRGYAPWAHVFSLLTDLRPWGPRDRVDPADAAELQAELNENPGGQVVLELELVFRKSSVRAAEAVERVSAQIGQLNARVVDHSRIPEVSYEALLVEVPAIAVAQILQLSIAGIAGIDEVMHVRPQSSATSVETEPSETAGLRLPNLNELGSPILALLDGVPMVGHPLLRDHVVLDDIFDLEPDASVDGRVHGTAMASLVVHGDRGVYGAPLPRQVHVVPVISSPDGHDETFPISRLLVDVVYRAVVSMKGGREPSAPDVIVVNISLGNKRARFHGKMSPWARMLDFLSYKYGLLFVVSAGNTSDAFLVPAFKTRTAFEDSSAESRAAAVVTAVGAAMAERTIIAPAESVNALTIGASNEDEVSEAARAASMALIDPFPSTMMCNPSSTLGPGYGGAVKPDLLMAGGRERLSVLRTGPEGIVVSPGRPSRSNGLKVAAPPVGGQENAEAYTTGTSAAAALISRTCHRVHDALERVYGAEFLGLPSAQRAVLLKALACHTAKWPEASARLIVDCLGPADTRQHARRRDNVRRLIGYGVVDAEASVACAADRATLWAVGSILEDQVITVPIPLPMSLGGVAAEHEISATVAWFTPVVTGAKVYRSVRLNLSEPILDGLGIAANKHQPDSHQIRRGTVISRRWSGARAAAVAPDSVLQLHIQREPDQGGAVDESVPFAIAVSIIMPGVDEIYAEVRQRLEIRPLVAG